MIQDIVLYGPRRVLMLSIKKVFCMLIGRYKALRGHMVIELQRVYGHKEFEVSDTNTVLPCHEIASNKPNGHE